MSNIKTQLKLAREAISSKDWSQVESISQSALEIDHQSYNALVFLGLAQLNLNKIDQSESSYRSAIQIDRLEPLAWQGLLKLYDQYQNLDRSIEVLKNLCDIWYQKGDLNKLAQSLSKLILLPGKSTQQSISTLSLIFPGSPYLDLLSTLPEHDPTNTQLSELDTLQSILSNTLPSLLQLINLIKSQLSQNISREISNRRTRLTSIPKTAHQTKSEIICELYPICSLPTLWNQVLDHPYSDDQDRRFTESELLTFYLDWLNALSSCSPDTLLNSNQQSIQISKDDLRSKVQELALGRVILKISDQTSWDIVLDWGQILKPGQSHDPNGHLKSLPEAMPNSPLSDLVLAFEQLQSEPQTEDALKFEDPLSALDSGFEVTQSHSIFSHLLTASVYHHLKDWSRVAQIAQTGMSKLITLEKLIGKRLQKIRTKLTYHLAIAYTLWNPPTHHLRAIRYLNEALEVEPQNSAILMAKGCVAQHAKKYGTAVEFFTQSLEQMACDTDPMDKLDIQSKRATCQLELGLVDLGIENLEGIIKELEELDPDDPDVCHSLAENWFLLGRSKWTLAHPDLETTQEVIEPSLAEELCKAAYAFFIKTIKYQASFAPAFTYLGLYYSERNDDNRASKCFQKAFELDSTQTLAAYRLASQFADEREWELVEVVARKLVGGGLLIPTTQSEFGTRTSSDLGSMNESGDLTSYQEYGWAWKALGIVELNKGKYTEASIKFQRALRFSPEDEHTWTNLGIAYKATGKHIAAIKCFKKAREILDGKPKSIITDGKSNQSTRGWYLDFCIADTQRQIGLLEPAIELLKNVIDDQPNQMGVKMILVESYYELSKQNIKEGKLIEADDNLIKCLDLIKIVIESDHNTLSIKIGWKIAGDIFRDLGKNKRKISNQTFNSNYLRRKEEESRILTNITKDEKLKTHLSYFCNRSAKLNVDERLKEIKSVNCLEFSSLNSEINENCGIFYMISVICYKTKLFYEMIKEEEKEIDVKKQTRESRTSEDFISESWMDLSISLGRLSDYLKQEEEQYNKDYKEQQSKSVGEEKEDEEEEEEEEEEQRRRRRRIKNQERFKTKSGFNLTLIEAIQSIKKSIKIDESNPKYWNVLGILTFKRGFNYKISQHSFIRTIELNRYSNQNNNNNSRNGNGGNGGEGWKNLGYLYLMNYEFELSMKCFKEGLVLNYLDGLIWFGISLIDYYYYHYYHYDDDDPNKLVLKQEEEETEEEEEEEEARRRRLRNNNNNNRLNCFFEGLQHSSLLSCSSFDLIDISYITMALKLFRDNNNNNNNNNMKDKKKKKNKIIEMIKKDSRRLIEISKGLINKEPSDYTLLNLNGLIIESFKPNITNNNHNNDKNTDNKDDNDNNDSLLLLDEKEEEEEGLKSLESCKKILEEIYEINESEEIEYKYMIVNLNCGRFEFNYKRYERSLECFKIVKSLIPNYDNHNQQHDNNNNNDNRDDEEEEDDDDQRFLKVLLIRINCFSYFSLCLFYLNRIDESIQEINQIILEIQTLIDQQRQQQQQRQELLLLDEKSKKKKRNKNQKRREELIKNLIRLKIIRVKIVYWSDLKDRNQKEECLKMMIEIIDEIQHYHEEEEEEEEEEGQEGKIKMMIESEGILKVCIGLIIDEIDEIKLLEMIERLNRGLKINQSFNKDQEEEDEEEMLLISKMILKILNKSHNEEKQYEEEEEEEEEGKMMVFKFLFKLINLNNLYNLKSGYKKDVDLKEEVFKSLSSNHKDHNRFFEVICLLIIKLNQFCF